MMPPTTPRNDRDRGRIQHVDVILGFATLVTFTAIAPWVYHALQMARDTVDPFTAALLALVLPFFIISLIVSLGVSARTN